LFDWIQSRTAHLVYAPEQWKHASGLVYYGYDAGDNMSQRARYNAQSGTTDTWTYAYNNGNEQTSMTLNSGTPETRTYDDWGRLSGRAQGSYSATYGYRYGGRTYSVATTFPGEANATLNYRADGRLYQRTQGSTTKTG
jgi:hypothetical protein